MSIAYYGSKISPHITRTPEGYLICHDVPICRVGTQKYLGRELEKTGADAEKIFEVIRPPEEVLSTAALASFEGKPVTDNHPPDLLTLDDVQAFEKGHAQNVRKGTGEDKGCVIADLYIIDQQLIDEIMSGKREVSCGYNLVLRENKDGTFEQTSIRGNHIAIVENGRAGSRVAIKDSKPEIKERGNHMATQKSGILGRMFKAFAQDENTTPEDVEEAMKTVHSAKDELPTQVKEEPEKPDKSDDKPESAEDEVPAGAQEVFSKILTALERIEAAVTKAPEKTEDDLDSLIGEEKAEPEKHSEDEDPEEQEPSVTVSPESVEGDSEKKNAMDEARTVAIGVRKVLQKAIKDPVAYKTAAKDSAEEIRKAFGIESDNSGYGRFIKATAAASKKQTAQDSIPSREKIIEDQQSAYDALNPHKHKEEK